MKNINPNDFQKPLVLTSEWLSEKGCIGNASYKKDNTFGNNRNDIKNLSYIYSNLISMV